MYCRNCRNEVSDKAIICVSCGTPPKSGDKYCWHCNSETNSHAEICLKCGVGLENPLILTTRFRFIVTTSFRSNLTTQFRSILTT